ncbi:MAG: DNA/RNA nuclease SfsA [Fervidicoccaceae archaeon]
MLLSFEEVKHCTVLERLSRFSVTVSMDGKFFTAWLSNSGRLKDLVFPGAESLCLKTSGEKTRARILASFGRSGRGAVLVDTKVQERAFEAALSMELIPFLKGCRIDRRGAKVGRSLLDYEIECREGKMFVELKSAAAERGEGSACYPDAPSIRGRRHVDEMIEIVKNGGRAAIVFIAPFDWAKEFRPCWEIDGEMGKKLLMAESSGILIRALSMGIRLVEEKRAAEIFISSPSIPVRLG